MAKFIDRLLEDFEEITDVRGDQNKRFELNEILFLVLCSYICGYESYYWRN
jgi:hypothetical protein